MGTKTECRSVYVTKKALSYSNNDPTVPRSNFYDRADLRPEEIIKLVLEGRFVYLGTKDKTDFLLVWDHRKSVPVILLIARGARQDHVVSIWKTTYHGIPQGEPTAIQVWFAWRCSLAPSTKLKLTSFNPTM
jgi:hypothetical protein